MVFPDLLGNAHPVLTVEAVTVSVKARNSEHRRGHREPRANDIPGRLFVNDLLRELFTDDFSRKLLTNKFLCGAVKK